MSDSEDKKDDKVLYNKDGTRRKKPGPKRGPGQPKKQLSPAQREQVRRNAAGAAKIAINRSLEEMGFRDGVYTGEVVEARAGLWEIRYMCPLCETVARTIGVAFDKKVCAACGIPMQTERIKIEDGDED